MGIFKSRSTNINKRSMHYLYALVCPRSNKVVYYGSSIDPKKRYNSHVSEKNTKKREWVDMLKKDGLKPLLLIIQEFSNKELCVAYELVLIKEKEPVFNYRKNA